MLLHYLSNRHKSTPTLSLSFCGVNGGVGGVTTGGHGGIGIHSRLKICRLINGLWVRVPLTAPHFRRLKMSYVLLTNVSLGTKPLKNIANSVCLHANTGNDQLARDLVACATER